MIPKAAQIEFAVAGLHGTPVDAIAKRVRVFGSPTCSSSSAPRTSIADEVRCASSSARLRRFPQQPVGERGRTPIPR